MPSNDNLVIHLFHGRTAPDQRLRGWGSDGPGFLVSCVHVTYCRDIKLDLGSETDGELLFVEDFVYYDGRLYGDWMVEPASVLLQDPGLLARVEAFDPRKAELPRLQHEHANAAVVVARDTWSPAQQASTEPIQLRIARILPDDPDLAFEFYAMASEIVDDFDDYGPVIQSDEDGKYSPETVIERLRCARDEIIRRRRGEL